ncbi:MAG: NDP-sugar synthase [bacterium]
MKAFILAAGYGTRLEPLTIAVPKPMIPVAGLPVMEHNIELLEKYGFTDVTANIHYHPEQIENYFGLKLDYSFEEELLGTAGGVKRMAKATNETFLVLSSDALTDIDLGKMLAFHRQKKAIVTVALSKVFDVTEFGVVVQDKSGRIVGFQEKPKPEQALSDLANTGIYIFEPEILKYIPEGFYDFGRQLFPKLVEKDVPLFGYQLSGYWNDVGNLDQYRQSNYDVVNGKVAVRSAAKKLGSSILGEGCSIASDAKVDNSIIWSEVIIASGAQVESSIIGSFTYIGKNVKIGAGSVIANRCQIHSGVELPPGTRLHPDTIV